MIQVLSDETINQIAAGEVIERPLSIVKELLENSIDAGASSVSIEIREGGIGLIRITDNGSGIEKTEVRSAFLRHATSKIRDAGDLESIHTLGFRGEALASITAVSKVELITKQEGELLATHYSIEGGVEKDLSEIGAPDGTTMLVRELFYNVPARRKFLKSAPTEAARIQEIIEKEALAHPEVAFRFIQDGKQKLQTLGNGSLLDVIYAIFGREVASQLLSVKGGYLLSELTGLPKISVRGFVGKPATNRSNRNFEIYFVNSRFVKDSLLTKAIEDGYRAFLMQHKFPFTVLRIDISPELVDVNVHPQKLEVRFADGISVYNAVVDAINQALHETELVVNTDLEELSKKEEAPREEAEQRTQAEASEEPPKKAEKLLGAEPFEKQRASEFQSRYEEKLKTDLPAEALPKEDIVYSGSASELELAEPVTRTVIRDKDKEKEKKEESYRYTRKEVFGERHSSVPLREVAGEVLPEKKDRTLTVEGEKQIQGEQGSLFEDRFLSEKARLQHRIIGQLFETYWLIEYGDKLFIIDQHAAHEKVNFERMMKRLKEKRPVSQYLNPPILLTVGSEEALLLTKYQEYFTNLGFEIRDLGGRDFSVSAVPAELPELEKKELLFEILAGISEDTGLSTPESIYYKIATMSCKAAVKGNNRLSLMEADALISELLTLDNPYACPHGRPTIISMSKYELEKKFKRIV